MWIGSFGPAAVVAGLIGLSGCGGAATPYTAAATVPCLRERAAALLQPSRAAAREVRRGPHRVRVVGVTRSGSTIGRRASGDFQIVLYPSEEILYFHFARSDDEASALVEGYRGNLGYQVGDPLAEELVYRRRNVVVEWDQRKPTIEERRVAEECLASKGSAHAARRKARSAPIPTRLSGVSAPDDVPLLDLIPADAVVDRAWFVRASADIPPQIAVSWEQIALVGSSSLRRGLVIWQRVGRRPTWRRVYSRVVPVYGVNRLAVQKGDVTGDRHPDLLLFEDTGGSAGCGVYRLLATVRGRITQLFVRRACLDNAAVALHDDALVLYDGIVRDPKTLWQIHCCWTVWQRTVQRWRGGTLVSVERTRGGPPPLWGAASQLTGGS
jgi:hypothetical protein